MITRDRKILHISQAHVAPGMSLVKWQSILASYAAFPADATWAGVDDDQVDAIFAEIAGVVKAAREATVNGLQSKSIQPVDLYRTAGEEA